MRAIEMVDLLSQHARIACELDDAIRGVVKRSAFIQGEAVQRFGCHLCRYTGSRHGVMVGSGTDALQVALMSLGLEPGAEVITSAFSFVAATEVIALLGLTPVLADVDRSNMLLSVSALRQAITPKTRAIIPVHLFGQCAPMEEIMQLAREHHLYVIEDACQSIGACYHFSNGETKQAGTMGDLGCISFFPSKNLGCMGDGGAILTQSDLLYERCRTIANHGATEKYKHSRVGVNSRLDGIQAAVLDVKLNHLTSYTQKRREVARFYDKALSDVTGITVPQRIKNGTHVFHQYTIQVKSNQRNQLQNALSAQNVPCRIYYPIPIHKQQAFAGTRFVGEEDNAAFLSEHVLSLPIHTEMDEEQLTYIVNSIKNFLSHD